MTADEWIDGDQEDEGGEKIGFCNGVLEEDLGTRGLSVKELLRRQRQDTRHGR